MTNEEITVHIKELLNGAEASAQEHEKEGYAAQQLIKWGYIQAGLIHWITTLEKEEKRGTKTC